MKVLKHILLYSLWLLWLLFLFLHSIITIVLTLLIGVLGVVLIIVSVLYAMQAVSKSKEKVKDLPYKKWAERYKDKIKYIQDEQEKLDMYESYLLCLTLHESSQQK